MNGNQTAPSRPLPNPSLPYCEDCWSEGETSVLIDAWGDRYVEVYSGNLRQKQWQEVADAVNSRPCDARRPPRTDVQCKNGIDTLKKKYKVEKSKAESQWVFFERLDSLIGTAPIKKSGVGAAAPSLALPLPARWKGIPLLTALAVRPIGIDDSFYRRRFDDDDDGESDDEESERSLDFCRKRTRMTVRKERLGEEDRIRELSEVIARMAAVYERVELEKQRRMVEMEKERMDFAKSMEVQRMKMFVDVHVELMKMFVDVHVELMKMKRVKKPRGGGSGGNLQKTEEKKGVLQIWNFQKQCCCTVANSR